MGQPYIGTLRDFSTDVQCSKKPNLNYKSNLFSNNSCLRLLFVFVDIYALEFN
ncbi:hypothetical protein PSEUDO8BK_30609 [Pseudomonas sp. 8BK]|nr:hypothetical protein PSEUDO8BK_30609 [Pseudomonas sp. 8BK]